MAGVLTALLAMRYRFVERPDIALMLFVAATVYALDAYRLRGRRRALYLLVPMTVVWANIHPSIIVSGGPIGAFLADLKAENRDKDVMVMVFSEFGRRVKENGSAGTDHGAAGVMFFAGGGVKGGLYGKHPSLTDLDDGDMKYNVDFRDCYATVLENWLGTSADRILNKHAGRVNFV